MLQYCSYFANLFFLNLLVNVLIIMDYGYTFSYLNYWLSLIDFGWGTIRDLHSALFCCLLLFICLEELFQAIAEDFQVNKGLQTTKPNSGNEFPN